MPMLPANNALSQASRAVLERTAAAWSIAPASPRAMVRRAPRGYVPVRVLRRLRAAANASLLAHSW